MENMFFFDLLPPSVIILTSSTQLLTSFTKKYIGLSDKI